MRACSLIAALLLAGCGLTLDLDPPNGDAGPFDAGARRDGAVGMDAAIDAGPDGGGLLDGAAHDGAGLDGMVPDGGTVMPGDAMVRLDASRLCTNVPGGCFTNAECGEGFYCERPTGQCLGLGSCQPDDFTCTARPVCGCDGQTWGSPCLAAQAGISVAYDGACRIDSSGDGDWCPDATPRRVNRPCMSTLGACFDDADCGGVFPVCLGASGCGPGDEGVCWGNPGTGLCYRNIDCSFGETCSGADINLISAMLTPGECTRP